jgi:hypothetical protein
MLPHQRRAGFLTCFGVGFGAASITVGVLYFVWGIVSLFMYGLDDPPPEWMTGWPVGIWIAAAGAGVVAVRKVR